MLQHKILLIGHAKIGRGRYVGTGKVCRKRVAYSVSPRWCPPIRCPPDLRSVHSRCISCKKTSLYGTARGGSLWWTWQPRGSSAFTAPCGTLPRYVAQSGERPVRDPACKIHDVVNCGKMDRFGSKDVLWRPYCLVIKFVVAAFPKIYRSDSWY